MFSLEALVKPLDATNKNPTLVIPHAATGRMDTASDECLSFVPVRFEIYQISRKGQKHNTFTEMSARRCGLMGANILNFTHIDKLWGLFFALCRRGQPPALRSMAARQMSQTRRRRCSGLTTSSERQRESSSITKSLVMRSRKAMCSPSGVSESMRCEWCSAQT